MGFRAARAQGSGAAGGDGKRGKEEKGIWLKK
jgi:hypothetical protein